MTFDSNVLSVDVLDLRNRKQKQQVTNIKMIVAPKLRRVIKKSCRNCGWKLGKKPTVVVLYGFERVDNKSRVNGHKWCVIWTKRPKNDCCSEWTKKHR